MSFACGQVLTQTVTHRDYVTIQIYISVRRGKIDEGIVWIVNSAAFSVRVVRGCQFGEVSVSPGVNADAEHHHCKNNENNETPQISTGSFLI